MSDGYSGKFSQRQYKIQLPKDNLGEQKVLESPLFRLWKNLKSKILTTMVPPPEYTLTLNLPFRATRRLERMFWVPIVVDCYHFGSGCDTILPNILPIKGNRTMEFGQLMKYNKRNIFLRKSRKWSTETFSRPAFVF